jgi:p-hydroxybenzoate 3-monooxygenase
MSESSTSTQVCIIGSGPAGLLLSHMLDLNGVANVVLERVSREHVLGRIRAGVLEEGTVNVLREHGLGERMDAEGHLHDGTAVVWAGKNKFFIDIAKYTGTRFMAYGQTKIQEDLYNARDARDGVIVDEASDVQPHDVTTGSPHVSYTKNGNGFRVDCDFVAACDGFHGVGRPTIPSSVRTEYEKEYPFGWLGILSETPPLPELTYANHPRGFALASMRSPMLSRYYLQCSLDDSIDNWPDDRFWDELIARFPPDMAGQIVTGPSVEKSIAPLRSFVCEPMRHGNLFLAGDAAHIVPPTGAKGLNLAVSDVYYLSRALTHHYQNRDDHYLDAYSDMALRRVWGAVRFSWWLTNLLHRFPDTSDFDQRAQEAELDYIASSDTAQAAMCEQYAGLPFE